MRTDGELTLRQLTEEQRKAWEAWLLDHWGEGGPVTALHEAGQTSPPSPAHLHQPVAPDPRTGAQSRAAVVRRPDEGGCPVTYRPRSALRDAVPNPSGQDADRNASRPPASAPSTPAGRKLAPSERLLGQNVAIRLRSGETFEGRYVNGSRYEMQLVVGERRVVIFKHAVDWMAPVNG